MFKHLLVPLDGSRISSRAIEYAVEIAQRCNAELLLLRVIEPTSPVPTAAATTAGMVSPAATELSVKVAQMKDNRKKKQAIAYLREKAGKIKADKSSVNVSYDAKIGLTDQLITQYSKEKNIDIIIMTTHGKSGLKKFVLGSTTDAMVRESGKPLLISRPGTGNKSRLSKPAFQQILVCLDGTKAAEKMLPYAESMAQLFNSQVTLLQAVESGEIEKTGVTPVFTPVLDEALDAENYLKQIAEKLQEKNINVIVETLPLLKGDVGESILEYAEEHGIDLTMLTSHGEGRLEKTFTGSVCDKLLKESNKPLFIINPSQMAG